MAIPTITRDSIPDGWRWKGDNWSGPLPDGPDSDLPEEAYAAAYYDLIDALHELVAADAGLAEADKRRCKAAIAVRRAEARAEYLDLPRSPWLIGDRMVSWEQASSVRPPELTVTTISRISEVAT